MSEPVRVLVVDDSAFMRRAILRMLGSDPLLQVVGQASEGNEALRLLDEVPADVVTLDLDMPGLNGLAVLARMRERHPIPVVVLSGAAGPGADATLQALDLGAFDVVAKPGGGPLAIHDVTAELVSKVRAAAGLPEPEPRSSAPARLPMPPVTRIGGLPVEVVIIGTSTGGPQALAQLFAGLEADFPVPIVVLQHMPPGYTHALAGRLDGTVPLHVREAADGDELRAGEVLVAPSGNHLGFRRSARGVRVVVKAECPIESYYRPCIDYTFMEAARVFGRHVLAVVLTGMGADGADGVRMLAEGGAHVWAQDEASCTIFGMPRAAIETGVVEEVVPLHRLASRLTEVVVPAETEPAGDTGLEQGEEAP